MAIPCLGQLYSFFTVQEIEVFSRNPLQIKIFLKSLSVFQYAFGSEVDKLYQKHTETNSLSAPCIESHFT